HVVGGGEDVVVTEINLVLARRDFMVRRFDVKSHLLECKHDLAADVFAQVDGREVEIASGVMRLGGRLAVAPLKQEELRLRSGFHAESAISGQLDHPFERRPWTS